MKKGQDIRILVILIALLFIINYPLLDRTLTKFLTETETILVERVIDGDTIEGENRNESIRLLGINTPEKGDFLYEEAKSFLESEILNKTVTLEFVGERYDKYGRTLAYIFLGNKNINLELVKNGFANYYFYSGKDRYSDDLLDSWNQCIENNINLCEKSLDSCSVCFGISGSSLINSCDFSCDITNWSVRGEGREKFIFSQRVLQPGEKSSFVLDLSNTDGSLFLRDDERKLVLWKKS